MKTAGGGGWWRSRWAVDGAIVVVVGVVSAADAAWSLPGTRPADGLTYVLLAVSVGALLARRRWPVPVAVACGAGLTGWYLLGHRGELLQLASMVALYTVAVRGDRRRSVVVGAVAVVWSGSLGWLAAEPPSAPMTEMLWPAAALLLGEVIRERRELDIAYAQREAGAAAEREQQAQRRVQRERLRIAREFHDVVAHTIAAVSVQMAVAVAAFDQRPESARAALRQARTSSREALEELRAVVTLLREDSPRWRSPPSPGLDQLDELVDGVREAGVNVSLHRRTAGCELPAGAQLAVYRIVQEALTNVIRHAHAGSAAVSVTSDGDAETVVVEVVDDGTGDLRPDRGSGGYGLAGMAERAAALGGRVEHGPAPEGGFRVRAVLPTSRRAAADGGQAAGGGGRR